MTVQKDIAVVGAGLAGLSAAIRLAIRGYRVQVFEKNTYTGGKMTIVQGSGFRFDAGPSLFTLPHLVTELFEEAGVDSEEYFRFNAHDKVCNYFWSDGTRMSMWSELEKNIQSIRQAFPSINEETLRAYFIAAQSKYEKTAPFFLEQSLHRIKTFSDRRIMGVIASIPELGLFNTLNEENERFFHEPKLVQLFNRYATYNGSSPYLTPGIMQMITHLEHGLGSYLPVGGMHAIAQSLTRLAEDLGVQFHLNSEVDKISSTNGVVNGIVVHDDQLPFDAVVCNADVKHAYEHLLKEDIKRPKKTLAQEPSSSALIFYWGVQGEFPELDMHNIFFSDDYRREFENIQNNGAFWEDPTIYVNITSKFESGDAPAGSENWFVMINVPYDQGQDWQQIRVKAKEHILQRLNKELGRDIQGLIRFEDVLDPPTIEQRTSSKGGALYGTSSNDRMAAFLRHPNKHMNAEGLYLCGGSAHPGGGVPLCLLSGKITANWLSENV